MNIEKDRKKERWKKERKRKKKRNVDIIYYYNILFLFDVVGLLSSLYD